MVLAGDYNVMPTELDVYKPERWLDDALFRPEVRAAFRELVAQGWTDALRALHPDERIYTLETKWVSLSFPPFGGIGGNARFDDGVVGSRSDGHRLLDEAVKQEAAGL